MQKLLQMRTGLSSQQLMLMVDRGETNFQFQCVAATPYFWIVVVMKDIHNIANFINSHWTVRMTINNSGEIGFNFDSYAALRRIFGSSL
jgi:hypothetical protein